MENIRALSLLGINEDNIARYSVRLSKVLPWFDPTNLMFNPAPESQERFYNHLFGRRWPDGHAHNIVGDIVLQFQELEEKSSRYVFCGAFHRGPIVNVGNGYEIYQWRDQEIEEYRPFVGRMIVHYKRHSGYTGMDFRLNKVEWANSFMDTMTVDAIKNNTLTLSHSLDSPKYASRMESWQPF